MAKINMRKDVDGKKSRVWSFEVDGVDTKVSWGVEDGKLQEREKTIEKGKYLGKINELTAEEVAMQDAIKRVDAKLADGYDFDETADQEVFDGLVEEFDVVELRIADAKEQREAEKAEAKAKKEAEKAEAETADTDEVDAEEEDEEVEEVQ